MIALSLAVVAFLYGAVGHAGATGYIAVFALAGLAPEQIRPTALLLNVVVTNGPYHTLAMHTLDHTKWWIGDCDSL